MSTIVTSVRPKRTRKPPSKKAAAKKAAASKPRLERRSYPILLDIVPLSISVEAQARRERRAAEALRTERCHLGLAAGDPRYETPVMFFGTPMPTALDTEVSKRMHNVLRRWLTRRFRRRGWLRTGDYLIETNEMQDFWSPAFRTYYLRTPYVVPDEPLQRLLGHLDAYMIPLRHDRLTATVEV